MEIKLNEKYAVKVFAQENEGLGVTKIDNMVSFVENGLPGDEGEVEITELKKNYARGKMISFTTLSGERQEAPCPYFDECGGCDLQHQKYAYQLVFKEHKVKTALERIGGFKDVSINEIVFGEQFYYRNKITLKVKGDKLGLYKHNTNDIIDIESCLISNKKINEAIGVMRLFIKQYNENTFDSIVIRYSNKLMISVDGSDDLLETELVDFLPSKIENLQSLILNGKTIFGDDYIEEKIDDLTFKLSPKSFYQVNNSVMKKLYNKTIEYVSSIENNTILDLYCGIGTITSLLSSHADKVIGIEVVDAAIVNAEENLLTNNIENVTFLKGKVGDAIKSLMEVTIDTVVIDPPRIGVEKWTLDSIIKISPKQIIYVSCNPVTLARDLKILCSAGYKLVEVTPFDMFPQTSHVECVVKIQKEDN